MQKSFLFSFFFILSSFAFSGNSAKTTRAMNSWAFMQSQLARYLKKSGIKYYSMKQADLREPNYEDMTLFTCSRKPAEKFSGFSYPVYTVLHHTAHEYDSVLGIEKLHRDTRGWAAIGYHFVIDRDGVIICVRPPVFKGAHTKELGFNHFSIGIALNGCFTENYPETHPATKEALTTKMMASYVFLASFLNKHYLWDVEEKRHFFRSEIGKDFQDSPGELLLPYKKGVDKSIMKITKNLIKERRKLARLGYKLLSEGL